MCSLLRLYEVTDFRIHCSVASGRRATRENRRKNAKPTQKRERLSEAEKYKNWLWLSWKYKDKLLYG